MSTPPRDHAGRRDSGVHLARLLRVLNAHPELEWRLAGHSVTLGALILAGEVRTDARGHGRVRAYLIFRSVGYVRMPTEPLNRVRFSIESIAECADNPNAELPSMHLDVRGARYTITCRTVRLRRVSMTAEREHGSD